jgi:hypothetical protein
MSIVFFILSTSTLFFRHRRYVLRLRYSFDIDVTFYGYDIIVIVTVTTSSLLLRLLEAYFKLPQLVP